jgi:hypothetical protein
LANKTGGEEIQAGPTILLRHARAQYSHLGKTAEAVGRPAPVKVPLHCSMGKSGARVPGEFIEKTVVFVA